jgi:hypothetical protein
VANVRSVLLATIRIDRCWTIVIAIARAGPIVAIARCANDAYARTQIQTVDRAVGCARPSLQMVSSTAYCSSIQTGRLKYVQAQSMASIELSRNKVSAYSLGGPNRKQSP